MIWKFDKESYNQWRVELLEEGFIPQLDEDVLSILIDTKTKRVERNAMRTHIPAIKKNYDEDSIVLDLMRQYKKTGSPIPIKEEKKEDEEKCLEAFERMTQRIIQTNNGNITEQKAPKIAGKIAAPRPETDSKK